MALNMEDILDLSLDDYIEISKITNNSSTSRHEKITFDSSSIETKFGRRKGNIDDEEDDGEELFLMQTPKNELEDETPMGDKTDTGIWKGPDSSTVYLDCNDKYNDLREKLKSNNKKLSPQKSAVQYRLMAPNIGANRPRGIPTLLPLDFHINDRKWSNKQGNRRNRGNRSYNNFNRSFQSQNNTNMGGVNSGRIQKNRNQDFESKNLRFSVDRNNLNNTANSQAGVRNMIIETPSSSVNLFSSTHLNSSFNLPPHTAFERCHNSGSQIRPIGNLTPQAEAVLNLNSIGNQPSSSNESLKSLLGFQGNVSGEMMPVFASRLMEFIQSGLQNPVIHKPVYDMKIQKDIHELQRKPLLYKCPGGEVISSDGAGVNCKIIPRTSGVSLNCRFA